MVLFFKFLIDATVGHCGGLLWSLKFVVVARVVSLSISGSRKNSGCVCSRKRVEEDIWLKGEKLTEG